MKESMIRKFTLIELLVVIAIISILMTILLPALSSTKELAKSADCASKLKQAGICFENYQSDWNGYVPQAWITDFNTWVVRIAPYYGYTGETNVVNYTQRNLIVDYLYARKYLTCPVSKVIHSGSIPVTITYGHNKDFSHMQSLQRFESPSRLCLNADGKWNIPGGWYANDVGYNSCCTDFVNFQWGAHNSLLRVNVAFADGHLQSFEALKVPRVGTTEGNLFWTGIP